jgi:hypothetical protein
MDADSLVSDESGNPTVYREDVVIADAANYGNKSRVTVTGELQMREENITEILRQIWIELKRISWQLSVLTDQSSEDNDIDLDRT